ncbi:MAG: MazG family protein [Clostridiales bacterium]|nr:MazG family protein [Clostridiales bacterium]
MKKYTFEDFTQIINTLRSENGCPWDREQTHESLKPCMTEEAYELISAINSYSKTGFYENMREELGDILLQVVMHSQIASEEALFTMDDVIQEICEKMIRRHPHVFGDVIADDSEKVLTNWDEIKNREKEGKVWIESPLREIPMEFPALIRAPKVLKKICGLTLSEGEVIKICDLISEALGPYYDELITEVRTAEARYMDETSWRENGKTIWMWTFVVKEVTLYRIYQDHPNSYLKKSKTV